MNTQPAKAEGPELSVKAAYGNIVALARAVQADARAHEVIRESLQVIAEALGDKLGDELEA